MTSRPQRWAEAGVKTSASAGRGREVMTSALVEVTTPASAQRRGRDLGAGRGRDPLGLGPAPRSGGHELGDLGLGPAPRSGDRGRDLGAGRGRDPGLGPALRSGGHDFGTGRGHDPGLGPAPRPRGRGRDLGAGRGHDPGLGPAPRSGGRGRDLGAGRGLDPGLGPTLRSGGHDLGHRVLAALLERFRAKPHRIDEGDVIKVRVNEVLKPVLIRQAVHKDFGRVVDARPPYAEQRRAFTSRPRLQGGDAEVVVGEGEGVDGFAGVLDQVILVGAMDDIDEWEK
nr:hypothetical protein Iba_chr12bCG2280 [Ipomoea batatas]